MNVRGNHYDVIIVGAGSMGMAAGYFLAKQRVRTLLIDAFDPPHTNGSHHGDTRIIRLAYGEGRQYVPLGLRAMELWKQLGDESGNAVFVQTGVVGVGEPDSAFIRETVESAAEFSLPLERLTAERIRERWPGMSIPDRFVGCLEQTSGVLFSEACIRSYRQLFLKHGGRLITDSPVLAIKEHREGLEVRTKSEAFSADKLIVTTGAWTGKLLSSLNLPVQPLRKAFAWFATEDDRFESARFPAFFFDLNERKYYGFPSFDGSGVKLGRHDAGRPVDPDTVNRQFGAYETDEGDLRTFLETYMPGAAGALKQGKVCLYTRTPDEHFIVDHSPDNANIIIATGFSGHGFKFSSAIGEVLSQMVNGESEHDISIFSLSRFAGD